MKQCYIVSFCAIITQILLCSCIAELYASEKTSINPYYSIAHGLQNVPKCFCEHDDQTEMNAKPSTVHLKVSHITPICP